MKVWLRCSPSAEDVRVEAVELVGQLGIGRDDLRSAVEPRAGQRLFEDRLLRTVYALQERYLERGYYRASVRLEVDIDEERKAAVVVFRIEAGERALLGDLRVEGDLSPFSADELIDGFKQRPGSLLRRDLAERDAEQLRRFLIANGYRRARVEGPAIDVLESGTSADVRYEVSLGPLVEIETLGAELRALERRDLLPLLDETGYDEGAVQDSVRRLVDWYQGRGHWQVRVEPHEEIVEGPDGAVTRIDLTIEIEEGTSL